MSKTDWGSPPDSPTHGSDIFGTSEAVAAQPPAPDEAPAANELAAEQPPAPEQPPALQVSMEMQLKHEVLKALFKDAYDQARAANCRRQTCVCSSLTSRSHNAGADGPAGRWCVARRWCPRAVSSRLRAAQLHRKSLALRHAAARKGRSRVPVFSELASELQRSLDELHQKMQECVVFLRCRILVSVRAELSCARRTLCRLKQQMHRYEGELLDESAKLDNDTRAVEFKLARFTQQLAMCAQRGDAVMQQ